MFSVIAVHYEQQLLALVLEETHSIDTSEL